MTFPNTLIFSKALPVRVFIFIIMSLTLQAQDYLNYPMYAGTDLGVTSSLEKTLFKLWAPTAEEARVQLYKTGHLNDALKTLDFTSIENGVWQAAIEGDWNGFYYTFQVKIEGKWRNETVDPYAVSAGVNGKRGMILRNGAANPLGWEEDKAPAFSGFQNDAVIYELHIRDATIAPESGVLNKGKFIGLAETGTRGPKNVTTGLDHLKDLGVTHVHLLPFYDYSTVDETRLDQPQYNWGYDPLNYNVPEGSYSTNPFDGHVRVRELKQMVMAFHKNKLHVVMDVVYNHTMFDATSNFSQLVPGYYYRQKADGSFSNASGCGNETASDRPMMRKYIIESLLHWMQEYHLDGFRFDLMAIHDIETMNQIAAALRAVNPEVLLYGEGWTSGDSPLPEPQRALKKHASQLDGIAVFSDDLRDALKGSVFEHKDNGFASNKKGMEQSIRFGIVAALPHPQVKMAEVNYSKMAYASAPGSTISYASCHDNHTLWDRLANSMPKSTVAERTKMHLLAQTVVLTSQGVPFLHAGTDFLRTKNGEENSYNKGDSINKMDWSRKAEFLAVHQYFSALIALRKAHPMFRFHTQGEVLAHLKFIENTPEQTVAYTLQRGASKDVWKQALIAFNGSDVPKSITLPAGKWRIILNGTTIMDNKKAKRHKANVFVLSPFDSVILAEF